MSVIQHDHAFQQVSWKSSDALLSDTDLSRTATGSAGSIAFQSFRSRNHISPRLAVTIEQKGSVRRCARSCPLHLLHDPSSIEISCHVATQNLAPIETWDEIATQNAKRECRYRKDECSQLPRDSSGETSACFWRVREI
jgi:hypothetical protein